MREGVCYSVEGYCHLAMGLKVIWKSPVDLVWYNVNKRSVTLKSF